MNGFEAVPERGATIAIVGAGFCGVLAAIRLLSDGSRGASPLPARSRIVLIDPDSPGRGIAYRAGPAHWLLNVSADRMSAFSEWPADFLDWARERNESVRPEDYLPRSAYGDYLASRLELARRSAKRIEFAHIRARVSDLTISERNTHLLLDNGVIVAADRVLLALGNPPASSPIPGMVAFERYVADPWDREWLDGLPAAARVVMIGTGLTMVDTALNVSSARPRARMLAISRHGRLPRAHGEPWTARAAVHFPAQKILARGPLRARMRIVRQLIDSSTRAGGDWQSIIEGVRQAMPALWSDLPDADRARFLRHVRLWWDIHRHRAPRQTLEQIEDLRRSHRLSVHAGRLLGFSPKGPRLGLIWRARGTTQICQDDADVVVNVTGPDTDPRRSSCPLVRSLLAQGLARADQHGLGWSTTRDGRMLTARGEPSATLFYVGPLLRASLWEATAVPELRDHVDRTADALAESLTRRLRYTDGTFRSPAVHGVR